MKKQYLTRKFSFDSAHRIVNEGISCFNVHGHCYFCELKFEFDDTNALGYPIDFKEIKRVGVEFIMQYWDHGYIANPHDDLMIEVLDKLKSKYWLMSLNGETEYCNPSAENMSKEIFLIMEILFEKYPNLKIHEVTLWETPNCSVSCIDESISEVERDNWRRYNQSLVETYRDFMGIKEYDDRKLD